MSRLLILLSVMLQCSPCVIAYDHISYPLGKAVETPITKDANSSAPKWRDTEESPPISARRALAIATKERNRIDKLLDYDRKVWSWKLKAISLKPFDGGGWYWLVEFEQFAPNVSIVGMIPFLHIPVLMDGKTAVSKVRDLADIDFLFQP
ncbi:hypothetical protein SH528x_004957 [Novipirellula sp. SH528]|uniref:hypothetical protein n=1 Tax=Novipirellula sp. SH528 TaxID=3454466 RepID=UPI003FA00C6B